jgi:4-amino-4-deoxy-L-arabinose transferase-like glycosyltransferase
VGVGDRTSFWRSAQAAVLCAVAVCLLLPWLGSGSLANGDDAVYAWAARRMLEDDTWLTYRWHDAALFGVYPPLHFVLLRVSLTVFGESELAYRLPSALAALASVLLTAGLTFRVTHSRTAGLLAGLALLGSTTFYLAARSVRLDMTFLALALAAYDSYLRAQHRPSQFWLLGLFCGLGYLTKSLLVAFVILPVLLDVVLFRRELLRVRSLYGGALLFLCIASSWHLSLWVHDQPVVPAYGERILRGIAGDFSFASMIERVIQIEGAVMALWGAGLLLLLVRSRGAAHARFCALALFSGLLILLATRTALPHYALSLFPLLSLGVGWLLATLLEKRPVLVPLAVCALLGVFAAKNLALFVHPDLSPGAREVAQMARERGPRGRVLFFRDYSAAFDFYLNGPTLLVTESRRAYDLYVAHPAMRDGPGIALLEPDALLARLAAPEMMVATTLEFEPGLSTYLNQLPSAARATLRRWHSGGYVLYESRTNVRAAQLSSSRGEADDD